MVYRSDYDALRAYALAERAARERAEQRVRELEADAEQWRTLGQMQCGGTALGINLNANDTFAYSSADVVTAETVVEIEDVIAAYAAGGHNAVMAWMEDKMQRPVLEELRADMLKGRAAMDSARKERSK